MQHDGMERRMVDRRQGSALAGEREAEACASQALLDAGPYPALMLDARGVRVLVNAQWQQQLGQKARPGMRGLLASVPRAWRRPLHGLMQRLAGQAQTVSGSLEMTCPRGQSWQLQLQLTYRARMPAVWLLQALPMGAGQLSPPPQVQLHESMLDASVDCIKVINVDGSLRHMNRSGCMALGLPAEEQAFGMPWLELLPAEFRARGRRALARAVAGRSARFSGKSVLAGLPAQYWDNLLTPMLDDAQQVTGVLCVSRDISAQREAELRLQRSSDTDALTGLYNRSAFMRRLRGLIQRGRGKQQLGLMMIDLDHFKHTNDTLGHPAGDHLLRVLARRLDATIGQRGMVTRLGGDEFAILLPAVDGPECLQQLAETVRQLAYQPIHYAGKVINGGMSVGCARYPADAHSAADLLRAADTALNDLKANGRGGVRMYSARLLHAAEHAAGQLRLARQIVRDGGVVPYYQPKVRLSDGGQVGYEALLRWHSRQDGGMAQGCQMDEAFADYELAVGLAEQMHNKVLADMAGWQRQGLPVLPVAINASPVEFLRDDFAESLLTRAARHQVSPALLEVEITEQVLADRGAAFVVRALHKLKDAGVRIALDDFGTGHSSLAHLRDYPIHCLKIDRSFISRMESEPSIRAIIQAVATLGPSLNIDLVAEGVENLRQRELLLAAGCWLGQGFLYAPALPATAVAQCLANSQQAPGLQAVG